MPPTILISSCGLLQHRLSFNVQMQILVNFLCGDWNFTREAIDKSRGILWRPTAYREKVLDWLTRFFIHFKTVLVQQRLFTIGCWTGSMRCMTRQYPRQITNLLFVCLVWRAGRIIKLLGNWIFFLLFANYIIIHCLHYHNANEKDPDWIEFTTTANYKSRI